MWEIIFNVLKQVYDLKINSNYQIHFNLMCKNLTQEFKKLDGVNKLQKFRELYGVNEI